MHVREIASRLRVSDVDHLGLERMLDSLSLEGVLDGATRPALQAERGRRGRRARRARPGTRRGARRAAHGASARLRLRREPDPGTSGDDVFIPPDALGGAMHGDKVRVRVRARGARGAEGEMVADPRARHRSAWPGRCTAKARARGSSPTTRACAVPSSCRAPSTSAGSEGNSGNDGDAVVVRDHALARVAAARTPRGARGGARAPGRALGRGREDPRARAHRASRTPRRPSPRPRPSATKSPRRMKEGRDGPSSPPASDHRPRRRARPRRRRVGRAHDRGGYRAWIAIADVSTYVTPGTAIDDEAKARGCSVYLPDRAIPMLPRALSSNLCSLLPDVDRLCLCVEVEIDASGHVDREPPRARRHAVAREAHVRRRRPRARAVERGDASSPRPRRWSTGCASRTSSRAPSARSG